MAFFVERPIPERPYFKVGEAAHILGVAPSTVRYWQKEFPGHIKAELSRSGQNVFSRSDVIVMAVILNLVRTDGMSIKDARTRLTDVIGEHGGRVDRIPLCLQFELPLAAEAPAALVIEPIEASPTVSAPVVAVSTEQPAGNDAVPEKQAIPRTSNEVPPSVTDDDLARMQAELDSQLSVNEFLAEENRRLRGEMDRLEGELTAISKAAAATIHQIISEIDG